MTPRRPAAGPVAVGLLAGLLWGTAAAPASAHVRLDQAVPNGDGSTTLTFAFEHGCDGGAGQEALGTVGLDLTAAAGVTYLDATGPDGWSAVVSPTSVRWDGPMVPDGTRAEVRVRAAVAGVPGETVLMPVVQRCEADAAYAWTDVDPGSQTPAPSLVLTAAVLGGRPAGARAPGAGTPAVVLAALLGAGVLGAAGAASPRPRTRPEHTPTA